MRPLTGYRRKPWGLGVHAPVRGQGHKWRTHTLPSSESQGSPRNHSSPRTPYTSGDDPPTASPPGAGLGAASSRAEAPDGVAGVRAGSRPTADVRRTLVTLSSGG